MKNSKILKTLILVLSLTLLIGVASVIGISAESSDTATDDMILAQNVIYGEKIIVVYAVNATIEEAQNGKVTVNYYWDNDTEDVKTAKLLDPTVVVDGVKVNVYTNKNGVEYPLFYTEGVAAKELGKVAHVTTDGTTYKTYSAAEYFYTRLYEDGFINKTEADGKDYNRSQLYQNVLDYGANAQVIFDYKTDNLVNKCTFVYSNNAAVKFDVSSKAVLTWGDYTVNAAYNNETELTHVGWKVTYKDGSTQEYALAEEITINGVACVEPMLEAHTCVDDNGDHFCDSCFERTTYCADADSDGKCDVCKMYTFEYTVTGGVSFLQFSSKSYSTSRLYLYQTTVSTDAPIYSTFGCSGQLIADPANSVNKVLRWALNDGVKDDGTNQDTSNSVDIDGTKTAISTGHSIIKFEASAIEEGGNIHILEMDFNLREIGKNKYNTIASPFRLYAYNSDGEVIGDFYRTASTGNYNGFMYIDQTNYIYADSAYTLDTNDANAYHFGNHTSRNTNRTDASNLMMFDRNEWYRFRFVWDVSTNAIGMEVSFDDGAHWYLCYDYTSANAITEGEEIAYLGFQLDTIYGIGMDVLLDDISYKVVTSHTKATEYGKDSVEASYGK